MKIINNFPKLTKLDNIENELTNKAPIEHSNSDTSYGAGSSLKYGHVKLSDSYKTSDGTADSSVAASSKAVADAYNEINSNLNSKNIYNTSRETITLSTSDQIVTKDGLLYGQMTANANSNILIYINNIPRTGIRTSTDGAPPVSMTFSIDVVKGDKIKYTTYNNGQIDVCYLYPKN